MSLLKKKSYISSFIVIFKGKEVEGMVCPFADQFY